jgi:hypothetical protein
MRAACLVSQVSQQAEDEVLSMKSWGLEAIKSPRLELVQPPHRAAQRSLRPRQQIASPLMEPLKSFFILGSSRASPARDHPQLLVLFFLCFFFTFIDSFHSSSLSTRP